MNFEFPLKISSKIYNDDMKYDKLEIGKMNKIECMYTEACLNHTLNRIFFKNA